MNILNILRDKTISIKQTIPTYMRTLIDKTYETFLELSFIKAFSRNMRTLKFCIKHLSSKHTQQTQQGGLM